MKGIYYGRITNVNTIKESEKDIDIEAIQKEARKKHELYKIGSCLGLPSTSGDLCLSICIWD